MSKVPSIGAGVITTDDVLAQGYDFVPLFQGGMAKVPADVAAAQSKDITGAAYTKPAALSLTTDLAATKTVAKGAALELAVVATGGVAPYSVTWFKGGSAIQTLGSSTLNLGAATLNMAGSYHAEVYDAAGKEIQSTTCVVTITEAGG